MTKRWDPHLRQPLVFQFFWSAFARGQIGWSDIFREHDFILISTEANRWQIALEMWDVVGMRIRWLRIFFDCNQSESDRRTWIFIVSVMSQGWALASSRSKFNRLNASSNDSFRSLLTAQRSIFSPNSISVADDSVRGQNAVNIAAGMLGGCRKAPNLIKFFLSPSISEWKGYICISIGQWARPIDGPTGS